MYYVIREPRVPRATVMHEDDYFRFYNPLRGDHWIEYSGSQHHCYRYFYRKYTSL